MTCKHEHDGITVGSGMTTGIPVSLNAGHDNVLFGGGSGSGKTFAMHLVAKRLVLAHPSAAVFVIDWLDEYGGFAKDCGLDVATIDDGVPGFGNRTIFLLKDRHPGAAVHTRLLADTLENVWNHVKEMPKEGVKLIILDEAWIVSRDPDGSKTITKILDAGKKRNVLFLASVQTVKEAEAVMYKKFDTHVFMRPNGFPGEKPVPILSNVESKRVSELQRGCGLLVTADHHVYVRFE